MSCVGVCNLNYLDEDYAASRLVSSENASYPIENIYDLQRRYKVWRSAGYYNIESGSNELVFREQAGVDITATITAGEYTSVSAFLTAIKTALDAAGVATYTVDTNNGRVRIASDLGGGATVFQLMTSDPDSATIAALMGFDTAVDFTGTDTYTADVLVIHQEEWLKWDLGFPVNPKAFILGSDRNTPLKLSGECVVTLQGNWTDNWSSPAYEQVLTPDDFYLAEWDLENGLAGSGSEGYRYWRVKIVDQANTRQYVELGLVYLGDAIVPTRGAAVFPLDFSPEDLSNVVISEGGQTFGQEIPNTAFVGLNWDALNKAEEQDLRLFFESVKRTRAFFVILDGPEQSDGTGAFSENQREWVKLVKFSENPSYRLISPNYFQGQWRLREEI